MSPASPPGPGAPSGSAPSGWGGTGVPQDNQEDQHEDKHEDGPPSALSDDQLVARARSRNLAAFESLVERHEERLYRVAMRLLRNDTDAREVLQEALLSAWQKLGELRRAGPVRQLDLPGHPQHAR